MASGHCSKVPYQAQDCTDSENATVVLGRGQVEIGAVLDEVFHGSESFRGRKGQEGGVGGAARRRDLAVEVVQRRFHRGVCVVVDSPAGVFAQLTNRQRRREIAELGLRRSRWAMVSKPVWGFHEIGSGLAPFYMARRSTAW